MVDYRYPNVVGNDLEEEHVHFLENRYFLENSQGRLNVPI